MYNKDRIDALVFCLIKLRENAELDKGVSNILMECIHYNANRYYKLKGPGDIKNNIEKSKKRFKCLDKRYEYVSTKFGERNTVTSVEPILDNNYNADKFWDVLNQLLGKLKDDLYRDSQYLKDIDFIKEYLDDAKYFTLDYINDCWSTMSFYCFSINIKCNWGRDQFKEREINNQILLIMESYDTINACKKFISKIKEIEDKLGI